MSLREQLLAVIERLPDEQVDELYEHARRLEAPAPKPEAPADGRSLMEKLLSIKIDDLPPDFSENFREYRRGQTRPDADVP